MNDLATVAAAPSGVRQVTDVAGLSTLYEPGAHLVVWERRVDESLRTFVTDVLVHEDLRCEHELDVAAIDAFEPLPEAMRRGVGAAAFAADVRSLCLAFAVLTDATRLGVRLARLHGPMCPRFHTDFVGVRLLTTYHGPGTEWLAAEHVDRRVLGHRSGGRPDDRSGLLRPGAVVHRLPAFAVALFKGEAWPGNAGFAVVHRSPPTEKVRLLLSVDVLAQHDEPRAPGAACSDDCCGGAS